MTRQLLQGATVVDGLGSPPTVADVAVADGTIVEVGSGLDGDVAYDYSGQWLLPGFIDAHVHVMVDSFDLPNLLNTPFSLSFYVAAANLERTLRAGITTVRDAGGADLGVKRAVELGYINGPDMQISVNLLSITGGHADHWNSCGFATPDLIAHPGRPDSVCDGVPEVIQRSRQMLRAGADLLKVCATGGVLSPGDSPEHAEFLGEELAAAVKVAGQAGKPVAAHAHSNQGILNAVQAGVWSIEHGTYLDKQAVELMLRHGTFLVPTLSALQWIVDHPENLQASELEQANEMVQAHRDSVRLAIEAGVPVAMGSDAGVGPHGQNLEELVQLVEVGMDPLAAIAAGTTVSAQVLRLDNTKGAIRPGLIADLVVLDADPVANIRVLTNPDHVKAVWKHGQLVDQPTR